MKKYLLVFIAIFVNDLQACEQINNLYKFTYEIKNNVFNYEIKPLKEKEIRYHEKPYYGDIPSEVGLIFKNNNIRYSSDLYSSYVSSAEIKFEGNAEEKNKNFFKLESILSPQELNTLKQELEQQNFKSKITYSGHILMPEYIEFLREKLPEINKYGNQEIIFSINLELKDKKCIKFETNPINYNFGNKYFIEISNWLDGFFDKKSKEFPPTVTK